MKKHKASTVNPLLGVSQTRNKVESQPLLSWSQACSTLGAYTAKFLPECSHHLLHAVVSRGFVISIASLQIAKCWITNYPYRPSLSQASSRADMSQFYSDINNLFLNMGHSLHTVLHTISLWKYLLQYHLSRHYQNWTCCRWWLLTFF